jgi:DNA-binding Lrp family transcriptional regulator
MRAYVLINTRVGEELQVVNMIKKAPGIIQADFTFGTFDAVAEVEAADLAAIGKLVFESIRAIPGVKDTQTCLAVE